MKEQSPKTPVEAFLALKKAFGTWNEIARVSAEIKRTVGAQSVFVWRKRRCIPIDFVRHLESESEKKGQKVSREEMRPDIFA